MPLAFYKSPNTSMSWGFLTKITQFLKFKSKKRAKELNLSPFLFIK